MTQGDLTQLHDAVLYLHGRRDPGAARLADELRALLEDDAVAPEHAFDIDGARKVQLAVFALQSWGKRPAPSLAEARLQAFRFLDQAGVVDELQT